MRNLAFVADPSREGRSRNNSWLQFNRLFNNRGAASPTRPQSVGGNYSPESALRPRILTYINYSLISFTCTYSYLQGRQPMSRSIKALVINHTVSCPLSWHHIIYLQVLASIIHLRTSHLTFHIIHGSFSYYKHTSIPVESSEPTTSLAGLLSTHRQSF